MNSSEKGDKRDYRREKRDERRETREERREKTQERSEKRETSSINMRGSKDAMVRSQTGGVARRRVGP